MREEESVVRPVRTYLNSRGQSIARSLN